MRRNAPSTRWFSKYRPAAVFHAAAHKHVPLMESCPREALRNNVFGTLNTVRAADAYGAGPLHLHLHRQGGEPHQRHGSHPSAWAKWVVQYYARTSKTIFSAVRFGNVLGSNGSVIPVFQRQIAAGGPVTVTHPEIERFFMTIPEASRLVIQAGGMAHGGEIFILDMGEPVKIVDLAKGLIQLQGLTPDVDVKIVFTGLREGEIDVRRAVDGRREHASHRQPIHHDLYRSGTSATTRWRRSSMS